MPPECNLGPLCYSAGALEMLRAFRDKPPVAAQILTFMDDVVVLLPPEQARNPKAVEAVTMWLQQRTEPLGVALNHTKSHILFAPGTCVDL